jgi:membrane protein
MRLRVVYDLLKETVSEWLADKAPRMGAALAYYSVFAIAPIVLLAITLAGVVLREKGPEAQEAIAAEIRRTVGRPVGDAVEALVGSADNPGASTWATLAGLVTLLFGAAGVFGELQDSLNTIWKVTPRPGRALVGIIKDRFLSFTMVLGTGFLLLVSLILSAALAWLEKYLSPDALPGGVWLWQAAHGLVSLAFIAVLFGLIYRVLPDVRLRGRDVWLGAVMAAALFTLGKYLLGVYLGRSSVASVYGAAGSLVVILLWVYYSSQILLFGAEFTRVYARHYGSQGVPAPNAVPVTAEARARQGMPDPADVEAAARGA